MVDESPIEIEEAAPTVVVKVLVEDVVEDVIEQEDEIQRIEAVDVAIALPVRVKGVHDDVPAMQKDEVAGVKMADEQAVGLHGDQS